MRFRSYEISGLLPGFGGLLAASVAIGCMTLLAAHGVGAGSASLSIGGKVPETRTLKLEHRITSNADGVDGLSIVVSTIGNGSGIDTIWLLDARAQRQGISSGITFDGRPVEFDKGVAFLSGINGRSSKQRLFIPAVSEANRRGQNGDRLTIVLRAP